MTADTERTLQLGRLGRTIGLDGGLLFHPAGEAEATLLEPGRKVTAAGHGELVIREVRRHNRGQVLHFEGIRRLERARVLTNVDLSVRGSDLPDDFELTDLSSWLVGLPVLVNGVQLGTVASVEGASGHEYLRLEPDGQLVPLSAPYVQVGEDTVTLTDPPEGLV